MNAYPLTVASPDGNLFCGEAVSLSLRGADGDLAVLAGHIPFATSVQPCDFHIELPDGSVKHGHTEGGILNVAQDAVVLLSSSAHWI